MSSRRRGRRHQQGSTAGAALMSGATTAGPVEGTAARLDVEQAAAMANLESANGQILTAAMANGHNSGAGPQGRGGQSRRSSRSQPPRSQAPSPVTTSAAEAELPPEPEGEACKPKGSCTLAQMRRFIKSRPYVPVHELRRRFEIEGLEDEVSTVVTDRGTYYVGLPEREAGFLTELLKSGDVGCELLLDPSSPAVVGVYAMRPVARQ